jgi:hypothetical protein
MGLLLCTFDNCENVMLPNDIIVLSNNEEDQKVFVERGMEKGKTIMSSISKNPQYSEFESTSESNSSPH